jgi:hypothetical protein
VAPRKIVIPESTRIAAFAADRANKRGSLRNGSLASPERYLCINILARAARPYAIVSAEGKYNSNQ